MFSEEFYNRSVLQIYKGLFLDEMRNESHELKLKNIKTINDLKYYLNFRTKYIFYKRKVIRKNVKLAEMVLEKQGFIK